MDKREFLYKRLMKNMKETEKQISRHLEVMDIKERAGVPLTNEEIEALKRIVTDIKER